MLRRSARNSKAKAGPSDQRGDSHPDKNSKAKAKQDLSEDPEDIDMLNPAEDDKDDDEDSRSKRSKRPAKAPPKKRAKVAHPTGSANVKISSATKGKQRRSLNLLLTMPLDVLFGIFCHLSPKDIINLSRTTKVFREMLMTRKATTVWKAARDREGAPECPSWMSEPAWAVLLFGFACQSCGVKGIPKADFLLMRRVCVKCKKRSLIYQYKIIKRYPSIDLEVLELVPATNVGGWSQGHASSGNFYWDEDVEAMIEKLSSLKKDAQKKRSNGQKLLDDFREERRHRIQEIKQKSDQWADWQHIAEDNRYMAIWAAQRKRLEQIKQKFLELGYEPDDTYHLCYREECNQKAPLTEKIWQRIRPALEEFIQERKRYRLERKAGAIRYQRRQIVAACYKDYQRTLHPSQWKYLPRVLEIMDFEPISRHLDADPSVEVTALTFEEAFSNLSEFIAEASEERKASLRALLPTKASGEETKTSPDPVELATAVFQCSEISRHDTSPYFLFGWEDISSHHCLPEKEERTIENVEPKRDPPQIVFSPHGAKVVQKLVELTGLDYVTATMADMDQMHSTYFCDCCVPFPNADGNPGQCRFGYNWRAMAIHLARSEEDHNPNFKITILSDPEAAGMKKNERNNAKWQAAQWTCAHCPEHLDKLQKREVVEQHLLESHAIASPTVPTDLFYFERCKSGFDGGYEYVVL